MVGASIMSDSIERGEGKFALFKFVFQSTLGGQVFNFVLVPERTG